MLQIIALVHNVLTSVQTVMPRQSSAVQLAPVRVHESMYAIQICTLGSGEPRRMCCSYLSGIEKANLVSLKIYTEPPQCMGALVVPFRVMSQKKSVSVDVFL